jgi:hypothetical protein
MGNAFKAAGSTARGAVAVGAHLGGAALAQGRAAVVGMTQAVRGGAAAVKTMADGLVPALRSVGVLVADTGTGVRVVTGIDTSSLRTLMSQAGDAAKSAGRTPGGASPSGSGTSAGPWQGKNGVSLTAEQNAAVIRFHERAAAAEAVISRDMQRIVDSLPHGNTEGWDSRLKTLESLQDKAAGGLPQRGLTGPTIDESLAKIRDGVRYTVVSDGSNYAETVRAAVQKLRDAGMEPVQWKNTWGGEGYHGINSIWRHPDTGMPFEVQFHTPQSFEAKTVTHGLYADVRRGTPDPELVALREEQQNAIFREVAIPPGAPGLSPGGQS